MIPNQDLVILMVFVADRIDPKGAFQRDVGGRIVSLMASEPFEKRAPHAHLWTQEWEVHFDLPKGFPNHYTIDSKRFGGFIPKTHLMNVEFKGDEDAFNREAIYAKLMS